MAWSSDREQKAKVGGWWGSGSYIDVSAPHISIKDSRTLTLNTTVEALYLAGTNGEGVIDTGVLSVTTVANEFNAEFNITASSGQDALLVVNATNSNNFAVYSYLESGSGAEIQATELTLIGVFNSNTDVVTSQFGFI